MARLVIYILVMLFCYPVISDSKSWVLYKLEVEKQIQKEYPQPKAKKLSEKAVNALKAKDNSLFKVTNASALRLAIAINDSLGIADAYWNYGAFYLNHQRYDSAYYYYNKSRVLYRAKKHTYYEAKMLYNQAFIKSRIKDYAGSEVLSIKAIKKFNTLQKHKSLYRSFNLLGVIYEELQQYDKAIHYLQLAHRHLNKSKVKDKRRNRAGIYNNLGIIYQKKLKQGKAINYFVKALSINNIATNDPALYARLKDNLAFSRLLTKDTLGLKEEFLSALQLRNRLQHKPGQIISHLHLAHYYLHKKDTLQAKKHTQQALVKAKSIKLNRDVLSAYRLMSRLNPLEASAYFESYAELEHSIQLQEKKVRNNFAQIQYETGSYQEENKKLSSQNIMLWAGFLILLILIGFSYFLNKQHQKTKKLYYENQQNKANERIYQLTLEQKAEWDNGRKLERERIAEELHDGILSKLFGLRLNWGFLKIEGVPKDLKRHQEFISELIDIEKEIRAVSYDLKSNVLQEDRIDFIGLLEKLYHDKETAYSFQIVADTDPHIQWEKINTEIKINLYRILEESFKNAYQHSKCTQLKIVIHLENNGLKLKGKPIAYEWLLKGYWYGFR